MQYISNPSDCPVIEFEITTVPWNFGDILVRFSIAVAKRPDKNSVRGGDIWGLTLFEISVYRWQTLLGPDEGEQHGGGVWLRKRSQDMEQGTRERERQFHSPGTKYVF